MVVSAPGMGDSAGDGFFEGVVGSVGEVGVSEGFSWVLVGVFAGGDVSVPGGGVSVGERFPVDTAAGDSACVGVAADGDSEGGGALVVSAGGGGVPFED